MAVAMSATLVTSAFAAEVLPESITIVSSDPVKIEDSAYADKTGCTVPEGYSAYYITVGLSGVGGLTGTSTRNISGKQMSIFEYTIEFDKPENVYTGENVYATDGAYIVKPGSLGQDKWTTDLEGNTTGYVFKSAEKYPGQVSQTITDDALAVLLELYVAVKDNTSVKATVKKEGCSFLIGNFTAGSSSDEKEFSILENNLSFAKESFTIGTAAPAGTTADAGEGVAVEAKGGKVWNNVVITNPSKGTDYKAKFTDNNGTADDASDDKSIEFPITGIEDIDEVNGDATFAVILKTTKTLANIALEILFQNVPAAE